jgi:hypothetical protein
MIKRRKKLNLKKVDTIESKKDDKVRVLDFKVAPAVSKKGQQVRVNMTIKNVTTRVLKSVPWQIGMDKEILHTGVGYNLPAGNSFKVSITWTAKPGNHFIYGDADPNNVLREPKIKQYNNLPQGIDVKVR